MRIGSLIGLSLCLALAACSSPVQQLCGPENCGGCCAENACREGLEDAVCGAGGAACSDCGEGNLCASGTCAAREVPVDAGKVTPRDGGEILCGSPLCRGCCLPDSLCQPWEAQSNQSCGHSSEVCEACGDNARCLRGSCVPNLTTDKQCLLFSSGDFGSIYDCRTATRQLRVWNRCNFDVPITVLRIEGGAGVFAVDSGVGLPVVVPKAPIRSAGLVELTLSYSPDTPDSGSSAILNVGSDVLGGAYLVPITGAVTATGVDDFQQPGRIDVMFVVDESSSVPTAVTNFRNGHRPFLVSADDHGIDYQLAMTDMDEDDAGYGAFLPKDGGAVVATRTSHGTANDGFHALFVSSDDGTSDESGINAAAAALSPGRLSTTNAGFLRRSSSLAVVILTDSPDQSTAPVRYLLDQLRESRPQNRSWVVPVAGFSVSPGAACASYDTGPDNGRYAAVANATAGAQVQYCTSDWSTTRAALLGEAVFAPRATWFLRSVPASGATGVSVFIDTQPIPAMLGSSVIWRYDAALNAVIFSAAYVPQGGQKIRITYPVACGQVP